MIKFFSGSFKETHTPGNSEKTRLVGWDLMRSILWAMLYWGRISWKNCQELFIIKVAVVRLTRIY